MLLLLRTCSLLIVASLFTLSATVHATEKNSGNTTEEGIVFPTIPAIMIPPVPATNETQKRLEDDLKSLLKAGNGLHVRPARCAESGELIDEFSITSINENGAFERVSSVGVFEIAADGSGSATTANVVYESDGKGAGSIVGHGEVFESNGDGSGSYSGRYGVIELDGNGNGEWTDDDNMGVIEISSDGSGSWVGPQGVVEINADGSGSWTGGSMGIVENHGDGTGTVNGKDTKMAPIPPVQPAGKFPPIQAFNPPKQACGYVVTLSDDILFDFDQDQLLPESTPYLDALTPALKHLSKTTIEVRGHTDSKGSDSYNQDLSERRANTLQKALVDRGVAKNAKAIGYGETRPVAPNQLNGKDNPSGRQLNRRAEIYIRQ